MKRTRPTAPSRTRGTRVASPRAACCRPGSCWAAAAPRCAPSADDHGDVAHRAADLERARAGADDVVLRAVDLDLAHRRVGHDPHVRCAVEAQLDLTHLAADRALAAVEAAAGLEVAGGDRQVDGSGETVDAAVASLDIAGQGALDALDAQVAGLDAGPQGQVGVHAHDELAVEVEARDADARVRAVELERGVVGDRRL